MALDFVRQRWFQTPGGYFAFVRTTRWEKGRVVGVKYSVAVGTQDAGLFDLACEGTGNGKLVRVVVAEKDAEKAGQLWRTLGESHTNGIPSKAAAKHYLSLERAVNGQIPPEQYSLLTGRNVSEVKDWNERQHEPSQKPKVRQAAKTTPHRSEIADDWMGEVPKPAHWVRTNGPRRYQVS